MLGHGDGQVGRRSEFDSRCSPQFYCKIVVEKNENKHKEAGVGQFYLKKSCKYPTTAATIAATCVYTFRLGKDSLLLKYETRKEEELVTTSWRVPSNETFF